jgi:hypothetical protein
MFAWIVVKISLARVLFGDEFVDQLNLCDLVIQRSFRLLAFSQNRISWHLLYFKIFQFSKTGAKLYLFKQKLYPNLSIYKTIGIYCCDPTIL